MAKKAITLENLTKYNEKIGETYAKKATTAAGYGITDVYTKAEIDAQRASALRAKGSCAFADLPTPSASTLGELWNVTDDFTTTAAFHDGADKTFPAGTNVAVVELTPEIPESSPGAGDGTPATYGLDCMSGMIDTSGFLTDDDFEAVTEAEILALFPTT